VTIGRIYQVVEAQRAALLRGERQAASELVRTYGGVWQRIMAELDRLLQARAEAEAQGQEVGAGWLYQFNRLETLQRQVEGELRVFAEFADPLITRQQDAAVEAALEDVEQLVRRQPALAGPGESGISTAWVRLPRGEVEDLVGFTATGSPLRTLLEKLGPAAASSVRDALIQGVALGTHPTQIARQVRAAVGMGLTRALTISRTETLRAYREATLRSYQANDQVVDGWTWLSAATARTCAVCWAQHGSVHPLSERLESHPNCRCSMVPHLRVDGERGSELGIERRAEGQPVTITPGAEQLARMEPGKQDAILGRAAGAAYRAGAFRLEDVVDRRFDADWGTTLGVKSLRQMVGAEDALRWQRLIVGQRGG